MTKAKTKPKSASNSALAKKPRSSGAGSKPAPQGKRAHRARVNADSGQSSQPRDTKLARVVELLKRPEGATLAEVMSAMGWLQHTTRAFMSAGGAPAKAGYKVESFKNEKGERAYRISSQEAQHA